MALYTYRAFTAEGKKSKGSLEAVSEAEAKEKIRALNLMLCELKEQTSNKGIKPIAKDSLIIFTSQLAQLIGAKIPLYESLLALEEQARGEPYHQVILSIAERVKAGSSLSKAFGEFPDSFSPLYRAIVSAGEAVGNLELSFTRLSALISYQRKMKKQLMSALTYPIFLMVLMVVALTGMIGFVVPAMEGLFEGRQLPWFSDFVFSTSRLIRGLWPYIALTLSSLVVFLIWHFRKKESKLQFQRMLLKLPFIKTYILHSALSRFARTLSTLLDGGLPLTQSLDFARESLNNARLEEIIRSVSEKVIEGKTISGELIRYKEIPSLFSRMVRIGEESGKLTPMLLQMASIYEDETERTLHRLVTLAQPVLLIFMGGAIGTVILSILLPLSDFGASLDMG